MYLCRAAIQVDRDVAATPTLSAVFFSVLTDVAIPVVGVDICPVLTH